MYNKGEPLMKDIRKYDYKRIDTLEMQKFLSIYDYEEFAKTVEELEQKGIISPVKSSKTNGKNPALFNKYNILPKKKDYSEYEEELNYKLNYKLSKKYYLKHLEQYGKDREYIIKLSNFLNNKAHLLKTAVSENERSFQIWNREKYLKLEGGKRLLNNLNFDIENLNIYPTTEPLAYFSIHKNTPQKILILENKDTFYTLRHHMLKGNSTILGEEISTVIYGRGKDIWKTFKDFQICVEPYLLCKENEILYLGDLDYEGIVIYDKLQQDFKEDFYIKPFIKAYCYMINKYIKENMELPLSKEGQNKNIGHVFLNNFSEHYINKIKDILKSGKYIPQEIININDLTKE